MADAETVPTEVGTYAGATLFSESGGATGISRVKAAYPVRQECYDLTGHRVGENARGVIIVGGKLVVR